MFILIFASILAAINFYLYRTATAAYPDFNVSFATFQTLCFLSVFLGRILEAKGKIKVSLPFSWIGFTWLGICGIALFLVAFGDLLQLLGVDFTDQFQFQITFTLAAAISVWGAYSARSYRTQFIKLSSNKLTVTKEQIRVVQISDLHVGSNSSQKFVRKLVQDINDLKPDIIVSTGDLFDGYLEILAPYVDILRELKAPFGKYAISGNHEVYTGLEECMSLTEVAGFTALRNSVHTLPINLTLVGVEDPEAPNKADESKILEAAPNDTFRLLLKHRPAFDSKSMGLFDLQLSGHTHGGQIFPFHLLTKLQYRIGPGLTELAHGQQIYVSRGTGTWGPQIRFLAPPELTIIDLSGN